MSAIDIEELKSESPADHDGQEETDTEAATAATEGVDKQPPGAARRLSVSVRSAVLGLAAAVMVATAGIFAWLYIDARGQLNAEAKAASGRTHAEDLATDYAVNAAQMDFKDFSGWKVKLVNGTSPELKEKLTKAADSMQQILAPLQWTSTARPLAAKVRSEAGGVYVVDSFVSVLTKTVQAPEGLQSTATYSVTLDSNNDWQITDVGGIDSTLGK